MISNRVLNNEFYSINEDQTVADGSTGEAEKDTALQQPNSWAKESSPKPPEAQAGAGCYPGIKVRLLF